MATQTKTIVSAKKKEKKDFAAAVTACTFFLLQHDPENVEWGRGKSEGDAHSIPPPPAFIFDEKVAGDPPPLPPPFFHGCLDLLTVPPSSSDPTLRLHSFNSAHDPRVPPSSSFPDLEFSSPPPPSSCHGLLVFFMPGERGGGGNR